MTALNHNDYQQVLGFLDRVYALQDIRVFPERLVREVPQLVGCHHCSWNDMAPSVPRSTVVEFPRLDDLKSRSAVFSELLLEHPGIVHSLTTGDPEPFVLSDALSENAFHRTNLYQRLFRGMGFEDQLGMLLAPPSGRVCGLSIARDKRGFSPRDREVMRMIRPHLARAHANAEALSRVREELQSDQRSGSDVTLLETASDGTVVRGLQRAYPVLTHFFRDRRRRLRRGLPDEMLQWLKQRRPKLFVMRRGNRRLVLRFFPQRRREGMDGLILVENRCEPAAAFELQAGGLTRREIEVLLEAEKGLTTDDIAAVLFISPRTVKKHLENIFGKLGVGNRTSAVYWLRRQTADGP